MTKEFPQDFIFGTSTSAYQIETAFQHDWQGIRASDGFIFDRTTDHEKRYAEDIEIISWTAPWYRMSVMWSRLQRAPFGEFDKETTSEYHSFFSGLRQKGVQLMVVIHHWVHPTWFPGWTHPDALAMFTDFSIRLIDEFGHYADFWNTFNEPNLFVTFSFLLGEFPPFRRNLLVAARVAKKLSEAHSVVFNYIKKKFPQSQVGISVNCVKFEGSNIFGAVVSRMADLWYQQYLPAMFKESDFTGISYYAKLVFDPLPITYLKTPDKIGSRPHDDIWELSFEGFSENIRRFHERYQKPIIITENGVCTNDDNLRMEAIKKYTASLHELIKDGIPIKGYFHWSTWDNFEWTLGPSYKFGLWDCDMSTMERTKKPSAELYSKLAHQKSIKID